MRRGVWWGLGALLAVVGAVAVARAAVEDQLLGLARAAFSLDERWLGAEPSVVWLNGARFRLQTGTSELSVEALVERAARGCREAAADFAASLRPLSEAHVLRDDGFEPVLALADAEQGLVACLGAPEAPLSASDLVAQLAQLASELDLARLGGVRLLLVRAQGEGSAFVSVASEGPLPLARLIPAEGDAPGVDPDAIARPEGGRRLVSLWAEREASPRLTAYAVADGRAALAALRRSLRTAGYEPAPGLPEDSAFLAKDGRYLVLSATDEALAVLELEP